VLADVLAAAKKREDLCLEDELLERKRVVSGARSTRWRHSRRTSSRGCTRSRTWEPPSRSRRSGGSWKRASAG